MLDDVGDTAAETMVLVSTLSTHYFYKDDKVDSRVVPGLVGLQAVLADQLFEATLYILSNQ